MNHFHACISGPKSLHRTETGMFMGGKNRGHRSWPPTPSQGEEVLCKHACLISERVKAQAHLGVISLPRQANS